MAVVPVVGGAAGAVVAAEGGRASVVPVTEGRADARVGGRVAVVPVAVYSSREEAGSGDPVAGAGPWPLGKRCRVRKSAGFVRPGM